MEINSTFLREKSATVFTYGASGVIGTPANTVNFVSHIGVTASVAGLVFTLQNPADTRSGLDMRVTNVGTNAFTMYGKLLTVNDYADFSWDNGAWHTEGNTPQVLTRVGQTLSLSGGGGSTVLPDNDAQTLSLVGQNLAISNGNTVVLPVTPAFATPAQAQAGTSITTMVNPADLFARENISAQTGLSSNTAAIPAPTAGQSNWGVNTLGETLHYAPGIGWKIVADLKYANSVSSVNTLTNGAATVLVTIVCPRAGKVLVLWDAYYSNAQNVLKYHNISCGSVSVDNYSGIIAANPTGVYDSNSGSGITTVTAGQIITTSVFVLSGSLNPSAKVDYASIQLQYLA